MTVETTHVNAVLRFTGTERDHVMSLHRTNPAIGGQAVEVVAVAIQNIRGVPLGGVGMVVTTELSEAV